MTDRVNLMPTNQAKKPARRVSILQHRVLPLMAKIKAPHRVSVGGMHQHDHSPVADTPARTVERSRIVEWKHRHAVLPDEAEDRGKADFAVTGQNCDPDRLRVGRDGLHR